MLLVENDEAEPAGRGEDRAASADDDLRLPRRDAPPVAGTLAVSQVRVQHGDAVGAALEAFDRLRRQADLGDQHDRLLALANALLDRPQVNLSLAATGHAFEQKRPVFAHLQRRVDGVPCRLLVGVERQVRGWGDRVARGRRLGGDRRGPGGVEPINALAELAHQPLRHQAADRGRAADGFVQLRQLDRPAGLPERVKRRLLLRRHRRQRVRQAILRHEFGKGDAAHAGLVADPGGDDGMQHLAPAGVVVVGHPAGQFQEVVVEQGRLVEHLRDRLDLAHRGVGREADAVAFGGGVPAAERRGDALADGDGLAQLLGHGVAVGVVERPVENDVGEQGRGGSHLHAPTLAAPRHHDNRSRPARPRAVRVAGASAG